MRKLFVTKDNSPIAEHTPWQRFQLWIVTLIFGAWPRELRVIFFRRWLIKLAFRFRWAGLMRASDTCWRLSRVWSLQSTQPAMAAYASKQIMLALMDGRETMYRTDPSTETPQ